MRFTYVIDGYDESALPISHTEVGNASNAVTLELRRYDAAGQQVWAGPLDNSLPWDYASALFENNSDLSGVTGTLSHYDAAGRLIGQSVHSTVNPGAGNWDIAYDEPGMYDGAGNVTSYRQVTGDATSTVTNYLDKVDGYELGVVYTNSRSNSSGNETEGILVNVYDANGYLVRVIDNSNGGGDSRSFVNDAYGRVLQKTQQGHELHQLVVNGNVIGTYGVGVDSVNPKNPDRTPNFSDQTDFDLGNRAISASFPNASAGPYPVQAGDTLRGIALAVYGDAELWYQIAAANGLRGDQDLRVGQNINIPTQVGSHNNASTFTPYNPSKITGSTSPNLPTPVGNGDDGCGTLGTVIMVAVAIAVTAVTQGAAGGFAGALLGAAAGSVASQAVGIAIGAQESFSWNAVGDAVLVAGITYGLAPGADAASSGWQAAAARAAVANVATQGIKVAVGSQDHFEWKRVAASAVGAGVGGYLNSTGAFAEYGQYGGAFARAGVAGLATAAAGGGKIEVERIAADAFGNTLGQAFGEEVLTGGSNQSAAESARLGRYEGAARASYDASRSAQWAMTDDDILNRRGRGLISAPEARTGIAAAIPMDDGRYRMPDGSIRRGTMSGGEPRVVQPELLRDGYNNAKGEWVSTMNMGIEPTGPITRSAYALNDVPEWSKSAFGPIHAAYDMVGQGYWSVPVDADGTLRNFSSPAGYEVPSLFSLQADVIADSIAHATTTTLPQTVAELGRVAQDIGALMNQTIWFTGPQSQLGQSIRNGTFSPSDFALSAIHASPVGILADLGEGRPENLRRAADNLTVNAALGGAAMAAGPTLSAASRALAAGKAELRATINALAPDVRMSGLAELEAPYISQRGMGVGNTAADGLASRNVWRDFAGQGVDLGGGAYGPTPKMVAQVLDTGGARAQRLAEAIRSGDVSVTYSNLGEGISGRYFPGTNEIELNGNMNWSGHGGLYDAATSVVHEGQHWMDDVAGIATNGMKSNEMYFEGRAFLAEQNFAESVGMPQLGTLGRLGEQLGSRSAAWDFIKSQYGF